MINLRCDALCIYNNNLDECICPKEIRLSQSPWVKNDCNRFYCNNFRFDKERYGEDKEKTDD